MNEKQLDVLKNAAALDEHWLAHAAREALEQALREIRDAARAAINQGVKS